MDGIDIRKHRKLKDLVINNVTDEAGYIKIYGKNADALILGDTTHEGGDIKVYRDVSGNLQLSLDADAASNAIALSIYGGVVLQNYLTVGQTGLNTSYKLYVSGSIKATSSVTSGGHVNIASNYGVKIGSAGIYTIGNNFPSITLHLAVDGTDSTDHTIKLSIDSNDIIVAQATGNGSGGITNKAIGFFGVTPQVQQAHIVDVAAAAGDPPTKAEFDAFATKFNTLLADLEGYGLLLTT